MIIKRALKMIVKKNNDKENTIGLLFTILELIIFIISQTAAKMNILTPIIVPENKSSISPPKIAHSNRRALLYHRTISAANTRLGVALKIGKCNKKVVCSNDARNKIKYAIYFLEIINTSSICFRSAKGRTTAFLNKSPARLLIS